LIKTPQPVAKKAKVEAKSPTKVVPTAAVRLAIKIL
jgi:hypothetical protein